MMIDYKLWCKVTKKVKSDQRKVKNPCLFDVSVFFLSGSNLSGAKIVQMER